MKKKSRISARSLDLGLFLAAAYTLTAPVISTAHANVELDRQYALETIGFLRATDNVDGLFAFRPRIKITFPNKAASSSKIFRNKTRFFRIRKFLTRS
jgi:hypothetical protein